MRGGCGEIVPWSAARAPLEPCRLWSDRYRIGASRRTDVMGPHRDDSASYHFRFASGFATSRARSMKSCATGLSARFFSVTIPVGTRPSAVQREDLELRARGGKFQCGSRENREEASGRQQTHPYVWGNGDHRRARIIKSAGTKGLHHDRPNHGFRRWQRPQFVQQLGKLDLAPPNPRILRARHDTVRVVKEKFEAESLVCKGAKSPCNQKIDVTLGQFTVQRLHISGHQMKHDARIAPGEPIDDGRNKARGQRGYIRSALLRP